MLEIKDGAIYYGAHKLDPNNCAITVAFVSLVNNLLFDASTHFQNDHARYDFCTTNFMNNFHKLRQIGYPNWVGKWDRNDD